MRPALAPVVVAQLALVAPAELVGLVEPPELAWPRLQQQPLVVAAVAAAVKGDAALAAVVAATLARLDSDPVQDPAFGRSTGSAGS